MRLRVSASWSVKSRMVRPQALPWQSLNFLPLPQGHGALRGVLSQSDFTVGVMLAGSFAATGAGAPVSAAACLAAAAMLPPPEAESSRSEEHTSELQSLMRISSPVFCLKKK